jgi:hypothetical protein
MFRFRRRRIQPRSRLMGLQGLILPKLRLLNYIFSKRYTKFDKVENHTPPNNTIQEFESSFEEYFASHISKYLGQTVTVFVKGGCYSGLGYTGILFNVNCSYIQLIIKPGPAPACSLGSTCLASIPLCKIASFVHNSV